MITRTIIGILLSERNADITDRLCMMISLCKCLSIGILSLVRANAPARISHSVLHIWFCSEVNAIHRLELLIAGSFRIYIEVSPLRHCITLVLLLLCLGRLQWT